MGEQKKSFWEGWWRELLMSFVGTTLSIALTFGTSALQEHYEQENAKRNTAMMAILDIDESIHRLEETISEIDKGFQACRYVMNNLERIDTLPKKTLGEAFEYLVEGRPLTFDDAKEKMFLYSQNSWENLDNVSFMNNVQTFYSSRRDLEKEVAALALWEKPISAQEYHLLSLNAPGDNSIDLPAVLRQKLQDKETLYYINWSVRRIESLTEKISEWSLLNDQNKFLMNISDEDLASFVAQTDSREHSPADREIVGQWERRAYSSTEAIELNLDHTFNYEMVREFSQPLFAGKYTDTIRLSGTWRITNDSLYRQPDSNSFRCTYDRSRISVREDMRDSVDNLFNRWYNPEMLQQVNQHYYSSLPSFTITIDPSGRNMEWQADGVLLHYKRKK